MPRYFFDVCLEDLTIVTDAEGVELRTLHDAKGEAVALLSDAARSLRPALRRVCVYVRIGDGAYVLRAALSTALDHVPAPGRPAVEFRSLGALSGSPSLQ